MSRKNKEYKYLLHLYSRVNTFLSNDTQKIEELPEVIVSFCIVVERVIKIKLHAKNPILIYDVSKLKSDDIISTLTLKKETSIETINVHSALTRFGIVFEGFFSGEEVIGIKDIYNIRNIFVHSYLSEEKILADSDELVKKMSFIWQKISKLSKSVLGTKRISVIVPLKTYTELQFNQAIVDELLKKLKQKTNSDSFVTYDVTTFPTNFLFNSIGNENCPRCGYSTFKNIDGYGSGLIRSDIWGVVQDQYTNSDIYRCTHCNLELTSVEYDLYKKTIASMSN